MFSPSKITFPEVGGITFRIVLANVDLPHPDSPTNPIISPSLTEKETSSTALVYDLDLKNKPSFFG